MINNARLKVCMISLLIIFNTALTKAQDLKLIPYPNQVKVLKGNCTLYYSPLYTNNKKLSVLLSHFNEEIDRPEKNDKTPKQLIGLKIVPSSSIYGSYELITYEKHVAIQAPDSSGLFNGLTTLLQLYKSSSVVNNKIILPRLVIRDQPRFAWRGFMLDESRHFFGKKTVEELLNWMAFYKLNRFHWHLSDSHGWRVEIKKYPLLTTVGGKGNYSDSLAAASYYTQEDIREIVKYAKARFITIVPEIDMPGHATAANRAYPEYSGGKTPGYPDFTFDPANEKTYTYLTDILKELRGLFPSGIIHIGGDEVAFGIAAWNNNPAVTKLMAAYQMTQLNQAEHYFLKRMGDSVLKFSNVVMCWDEAVPAGLPVSNTYINWWRQNKPESLNEAISKGYGVILCPRLPLYFDFVQDSTHTSGRKWQHKQYNSYLDIYHYPTNSFLDTLPANAKILGLQGNLWTETVSSQKRLQYLIYPRIAALAEAEWTADSIKNDTSFNMRLKTQLLFYQQKNIYYYNPFDPAEHPEAIDIIKKEED
jgi:hexosaminidase